MTTPILVKMIGINPSFYNWSSLRVYYATQNRTHVKKLNIQLYNQKKKRSFHPYFLDIKKIVDTLSTTGASIFTDDHVETILDGLPKEFDSFL